VTPDADGPGASGARPAHPSDAPLRYAGAVLTGGRSRRFGSDKCGHRYRGRSLLEHALASLDGADERWLVGGPRRDLPGARWIPDERPGYGALGGVHAALRRAGPPWLAVVGCDMPFLPAGLWPELLRRAGEARLVVPEGPTGLEPLAAVYHRDLMPEIDALLRRGGGPLRALLEAAPSRVTPWRELQGLLPEDAFLNANRPEDLP
jgi:molybdopterin-guanine dinucleotide biosynthesis protein A